MSGIGDETVVVYGANGATGARFVELAVGAGLRPIVAGRDRDGLERVAAPFGLEVRVGTLDDAELDGVCAGASVVVSCVAPYTKRGLPVVEAALRHGAHHIDFTGEGRYVKRLIDEYDSAARAAGIVIVPAAGIGLCANLVARTAARQIDPVELLTVDYHVRAMRPSWGTATSTAELLAGGAAVAEGGRIDFVTPGRVARLPGGMGMRFPLTDVLTLQRQWPSARIDSYIRSRAAPVIGPAAAVSSLILRSESARNGLERAAKAIARPNGRKPKGNFTVTVTAEGGAKRFTAVGRVADIYEETSQAGLELTRTLLEDGGAPGFRASGEIAGEPAEVAARIGIDLQTPQA
jgi:hypothetical protein